MELQNYILKKISTLAIITAVNSLSQASTLFTYQPHVDERLKWELMNIKI